MTKESSNSSLKLVEASPSGEVDTKPCHQCKKVKPLTDYYKRSLSSTGYVATCKECQKRAWSNEDHRAYQYKKKYGITMDDYNDMFASQHGECGICSKHQSELDYHLCVDHNHTTGEVRGLLCRDCNKALGMLGDDKESIQKVMDYL